MRKTLDFRAVLCILLIAVPALAALLFLYPESAAPIVCDFVLDGEVVLTKTLNRDETLSLQQLPAVEFAIRDRQIAFVRSDCPDKVCIHTGYLGEAGQSAACLPNRIAIRLRRPGGEGLDAVA